MTGQQRWSASNPCPICGGHQDLPRHREIRCSGFLSQDGHFAYCSRVLIPGRPEVQGGCPHWLGGPCDCGLDHSTERPVPKLNPIASPPRRDDRAPTFDSAHDCLHHRARSLDGTLIAVWIYQDRNGIPVAAVGRIETDQGKTYRPAHRRSSGEWVLGDPQSPWPLYNLQDVVNETIVLIVEGEKSVELLREIGIQATTSAHGSGCSHKTDWSPLAERTCVIIPDWDDPGQAYALEVGARLRALGCTVSICDLPDLQKGDDIEQWLERFPPDATPQEKATTLHHLVTIVLKRDQGAGSRDQHNNPNPDSSPDPRPLAPDPCSADDAPATEEGTAELLARWSGQDVRHVRTWKKFLAWDGQRWALDYNNDQVSRMAVATVRRRILPAKARTSAESNRGINAVIASVAHHRDIASAHDVLDTDPWLFNTRTGTLDLRTGELRAHQRSDFITQMAPVDDDENATCPLWNGALELIFQDQALIDFVQRLFGYFLTGSTREQVFPIFWGTGDNGKSTIINCLLEIMGPDYARRTTRNFLLVKDHEPHPTEIAALFRKRFVVSMESSEGQTIDETMIKELTGGDILTARRMREDFWEFTPTHKIAACTNHMPRVTGTDLAIWRRLLPIPFRFVIPPEKKDRDFPDKLRLEAPGILRWCVEGCLRWQKTGSLQPPEAVIAFTQDYKASEDVLGAYLGDNCITDLPGSRASKFQVKAGVLYSNYHAWCERRGETPLKQREFRQRMTSIGVHRFTRDGTMYGGIGLRADER